MSGSRASGREHAWHICQPSSLHLPGTIRTVDRRRAERQLQVISDVLAIASENAFGVWLRGGWAMDFFVGQVTRDHKDIDWLAWAQDAPLIRAALLGRGYRTLPYWGWGSPELGLEVTKDGQDLIFHWVARDSAGQVVVPGRYCPVARSAQRKTQTLNMRLEMHGPLMSPARPFGSVSPLSWHSIVQVAAGTSRRGCWRWGRMWACWLSMFMCG
jgi:hypothetical protein